MRLIGQPNATITRLSQQLKSSARELLKGLEPAGEPIARPADSDALAQLPANQVFLVTQGELHSQHQGQTIYIVNEGDLIGLGRSVQLPDGVFITQGPVELLPYSRGQLLAHVNGSENMQKNWAFFLLCWGSFFSACLVQVTPNQAHPPAGFLNFEQGDLIIRQGDEADCVYTLLEGTAEVLHNDVKVGEIHRDEIFGAMSVFTREPRSADVRATSACTVLAVKESDFLNLVSQQPKMGVSLIKEMAEQIYQLNKQIHNLQTRA